MTYDKNKMKEYQRKRRGDQAPRDPAKAEQNMIDEAKRHYENPKTAQQLRDEILNRINKPMR